MESLARISIMSGAEIRQSFIDYFIKRGHTFVPSSSLVPGGDQTLLFTNAGMVQFKDVFLGEDRRPYKRAVNSQKCMRVAGKHNDLEDVGRDDLHHTFFEMLGNWSFGDYYKKEAIEWAWELLTTEWGIEKNKLWVTYFMDEMGEIPSDDEAKIYWEKQPGINRDHILYFGRKDNFWEMADTGPCGPCSEIHIDIGEKYCDKKNVPGHTCKVNGDCNRFLELWNLVFIQYNRTGPSTLTQLPACHVDTGMGFERVVGIIQGVNSTYKTDLLAPLMDTVQNLAGHNDRQRNTSIIPYRVIADHGRAAAFLIADGVVPGNTGRNYICRMIIRRASRFGSKIGLNEPFLGVIAKQVITNYSKSYPELERNKKTILDNIFREEEQFHRTIDNGISHLDEFMIELKNKKRKKLVGKLAFDLYATHGLPLEITRDILQEQGMSVDEAGFHSAMEEHRLISGAGKEFGPLGGEDVDFYRSVYEDLVKNGALEEKGVIYDPYNETEVISKVLSIIMNGEVVSSAKEGDQVEVVLSKTSFYLEAGGQVSDTGTIISQNEPIWTLNVEEARRPAAGIITHFGKVINGEISVGDKAVAKVDIQRRHDIMRNHTATHLLHAELQRILGEHARQAGSLVAPDHLRFDFTHPFQLTGDELDQIENSVNKLIFEDLELDIENKPLSEALSQGATALFGEKYGETVRTIAIEEKGGKISYELCGGTHVRKTGDIGLFLITSEGSAAAGMRRIEAVTGRYAYDIVKRRTRNLQKISDLLGGNNDELADRVKATLGELSEAKKNEHNLRQELVRAEYNKAIQNIHVVDGVTLLALVIKNADPDSLRKMTDLYRDKYSSGVVVLGSEVEGRPLIIAAVSKDLIDKGVNAVAMVKHLSKIINGSGGGRPDLAQAGGKDLSRLNEAIDQAGPYIRQLLLSKK